MDMQQPWYDQLAELLRDRGHTEDDIATILAHVKGRDLQTQQDSIMDSIGLGDIDLDTVIKEALRT